MRKVVTMFFMLVSVLSSCGQTGFPYNDVRKDIDSLKNTIPQVVASAEKNKANSRSLKDVDIEDAKNKLDCFFANLDSVMSVHSNFEADTLLTLDGYILDFIEKYKKAIYNDPQTEIAIGSNRFIVIADSASLVLKHYLSLLTPPPPSDVTGDNEPRIDEGQAESGFDNYLVWVALILALIGGFVSMCISIRALRRMKHVHKRIDAQLNEIIEVEKRINQKIEKLKLPDNEGVSSSRQKPTKPSSHLRRQQSQLPKQSLRQSQQSPQQPLQPPTIIALGESEESQSADVASDRINLYATVKALSPYAEFFKVSDVNSGDKVFMLTLLRQEDEVAEFTIAPDMTPDFMKSVINDRDTYLPSLFCEKAIDSANPTRIEVGTPGRAKKVDGKWHVEERMILRLV